MNEAAMKAIAVVAAIAFATYLAVKAFQGGGNDPTNWDSKRVQDFCQEAPREWAGVLGHASNGEINAREAALTTYATTKCALAVQRYVSLNLPSVTLELPNYSLTSTAP